MNARFDDLSAGTALAFPASGRAVVADELGQVQAVLDEVDEAVRAGWWACGFLAYEAAPALDPALVAGKPMAGLPLAWFAITPPPREVPVVDARSDRHYDVGPWRCDWDRRRHRDQVAAVRARIAEGETYQCNLTTRLTSPVDGDLTQLYADLALRQRGAYNALLDTGRFVIASASPELFFERRGDTILMRPMKGTTPRGRTPAEDNAAVARLRASAKERAENLMIVDLVRNDVARVAALGSVTVPALFRAEQFETVHQLTSDVTATVKPGTSLRELFRALFPCGSVTGAPKPRTMELIRDLEDGPRGVYCGAIGWLAPPGADVTARFAVAIRTAVIDRAQGTATYGSGGGITWDSDAAAEYEELLAKTRILDVRPEEFHLIETMRHARGELVSFTAHLERMAASARYFGFRFDPDTTRAAVIARLAGTTDARVRLRCFRDGRIVVEPEELPAPDLRELRLAIDDDPIDSRQCWPHHKTSRRLPYTARRAEHPDADEVVLVNERGEVTETCSTNIAVHLDGRWWTPPYGDGCLPGIERGRLLAEGVLRERVLTPADLQHADGLALVNALRGWRPAVLDRRTANAG